MSRLRVVVATPLSTENAERVRRLEPRIDLIHDPELAGPPSDDWMERYDRPAHLQAAFERYVDSAEALYGVPDQSGAGLARTVAANPGLRWVHTIPAGGGQQIRAAHLDRAALDRILFTTSAGVHAEPLSEFAVFGVLAGAKLLPWLLENQDAHRWAPRRVMPIASDLTVAVVGLGAIGRLTATKLSGLGYRVIGVHRRPVEADGVAEIVGIDRLAEVAASVDAMVLALPGTEQTHRLISRDVLAAARPGLTLVNVGRGTTVDEEALVEALEDGRVGLAVLDVTAVEPLPADSPLWSLRNVIIAPHTAAISPHEPRRIAELFAENARRLLDGETLLNRVNTVEFY
ncbi:MAG TPA: D-2-hydroxyacid dehydrogenase [Pseudolysinimonas sp.]|jgi:phosphoglycerate dehydrogenase-like enzyme|nr:D-2-hydroxyacid dehydrogenase [Pseudolysinimonas sp.]